MSNYKEQLTNNTLWSALEKFSLMGVQLLCTFVLARYLSPSDFGIVGMIVVFTAIAQTIVDSGFGQALIREKDITDSECSSVFYFNVIISIIIYILLFLLSKNIAVFYNQPILSDVCKITFIVIPLNALCIVQTSILIRQLNFRKICIISCLASVISSIITISIAYFIRNIWALVIQNVLTYFLKTIFLWATAKWYPTSKFSFVHIKKYIKFSRNLLISGLIGNIFNNIHAILIGKFYSATDLGFYTQADRIKNVASITTTNVIQGVTYPILSKVNNEGGNLKEAYKKIIIVTVLFVGCVMALLMGVSFDLFELLMGNAIWRISGIYLFILCVNGILYPLHSINQNILMVKGDSKTILYLEFTRRFIFLIILFVTLQYNMLIFVGGSAIYSILLLFLNLYYCGKPIHYSIKEQLSDVLPIFCRQICMSIGVIIMAFLLKEQHVFSRVVISLFFGLFIGLLIFHKNMYFLMLMQMLKYKVLCGKRRV